MFLINLQGKDSIYEQIRDQIIRFIDNGILKPNDKLPSCRNLAADLGINPNTVNKAYSELEKNGYIYTVNKKGVFVSESNDANKDSSRRDAIYMANVLKNEGFSKEELVEILEEVYKEGQNA
ncbi:MAG: GntR family transcriptional regulator [Firmicutes bacterium]|nr:GntR family transcriptional regulator [Candidatus Colivicinus equi]